MLTGTSGADVAILVVSSEPREFDAGMSLEEGLIREHALLAFTMGVKQIIVCLNKMDAKGVDYREQKYNAVKGVVSPYLAKVGFNQNNVQFIPISAYNGDNLI
jgi:elongation factor 1-alpha